MMYMMTPEQHAQIVNMAQSNAEYAEAEYLDRREFWGEALDYRWKNLQAASEQAKVTLAALKAMQPVSPCGWLDTIDGDDLMYSIDELMGGNTDGLLAVYTPTKD